MNDMICCPLDNDGDGSLEVIEDKVVKARKDHRCVECRETIAKGQKHEYIKGLWDGRFDTFRTCLSCVEIRNHFSCGNGWLFGEVWSQLGENFFPDMKAGGPCMQGLSPEAKARLFERRLQWLEDTSS
jgi:hypothetical protein